MRACPICRTIYDDQKTCAVCGVDLSEKFSGMIVVINAEKSQISKIISKATEGRYAIKTK